MKDIGQIGAMINKRKRAIKRASKQSECVGSGNRVGVSSYEREARKVTCPRCKRVVGVVVARDADRATIRTHKAAS